jgi:hypothetical protein
MLLVKTRLLFNFPVQWWDWAFCQLFTDLIFFRYTLVVWGLVVTLHMCLQCSLIAFTSPSFSLIASPLLRTMSTVYLFYFHRRMKGTPTMFALLHLSVHPSPLPEYPLQTGPVLHYWPSFFKCIFIVQRGFTVVFHTWIWRTSIRLSPSISLSLSLHPLYSTAFILPSSHTEAIYFCIIHFQSSLFLSRLSLVSSNSPTIANMFLHTHTHTIMYVLMYTYIGLASTSERKYVTFVLLDLANFA